jgi:hypothetical protein
VSLFIEVSEDSPACHLFDTFWCTDVLYVAEIKCSSELTQERFISKTDVHSKLRTPGSNQPYLPGRLIRIETTFIGEARQLKKIDIVFNEDRKAWHYGWTSHKCLSERSHVVDVMVLVDNPAMNRYFLAASYPSPEFVIASTKSGRQRRGSQAGEDLPDENSDNSNP